MSVWTLDCRAETNTCRFRESIRRRASAHSGFRHRRHSQECCHHSHRQIQPSSPSELLAQESKFREECPGGCARRSAYEHPGRMPASHQDYTQKGCPRNGKDSKSPSKCTLWSECHTRFTWKHGPHRTPPWPGVVHHLSSC